MLANVPVGEAIRLWVEIRVVRSLKVTFLPWKKFDKNLIKIWIEIRTHFLVLK